MHQGSHLLVLIVHVVTGGTDRHVGHELHHLLEHAHVHVMLRIASGLHGSVVGPGGHHVLKRVFAPHILLAGHHLLHQHHHFHLLHPRLALVLHGVFVVVGLVVVHLVLHHVLHDGGEAVGLLVVAGVA